MTISQRLAKRREARRLKQERTGDTPQKLAERRKPSSAGDPTEAMARAGTVGFLTGSL
jgi:hypothetical protein